MLTARNVGVILNRRQIIAGIDLDVPAGSFVAVLGPNGSGKTTLLRALSGEIAYGGSIALNGTDIRALKPRQAATMRAVLPQATTLSFPFTVREVVAIGQTTGRSGAADRQTAWLPERALERVDLSGFAGRLYQDLSGGEQQRVQLARVLCQVWTPVLDDVPRYLLLDEPVSSLDIRHQLAIMELAGDFARAGGGVLAILHDLNLASLFADRMVVMHRGRVAAAGTPSDTLNDGLLESVFGAGLRVNALPLAGMPFVLPQSAISFVPTMP